MASHNLAAAKRLRKELQNLERHRHKQGDFEDDIFLRPTNSDSILQWTALLKGPPDTPYEGGVFQISIQCGSEYPLAPPSMKFVTKVRESNRFSVDGAGFCLLFMWPLTFPLLSLFVDIPSQRSLSYRGYLLGYSEKGMVSGVGFTGGLSSSLGASQ
jgi:hypothetical protein